MISLTTSEIGALAEAPRLRAENELLRAALKPFADFADPRKRIPDHVIITNGSPLARPQLKMQDCYAAADALHQQSAEHSK